VLGTQRDLTQAATNLVAAMAAYEKSRVELDRVTGEHWFTRNRYRQTPSVGKSRNASVPGTIHVDQAIRPSEEMTPPPATTPPTPQ